MVSHAKLQHYRLLKEPFRQTTWFTSVVLHHPKIVHLSCGQMLKNRYCTTVPLQWYMHTCTDAWTHICTHGHITTLDWYSSIVSSKSCNFSIVCVWIWANCCCNSETWIYVCMHVTMLSKLMHYTELTSRCCRSINSVIWLSSLCITQLMAVKEMFKITSIVSFWFSINAFCSFNLVISRSCYKPMVQISTSITLAFTSCAFNFSWNAFSMLSLSTANGLFASKMSHKVH